MNYCRMKYILICCLLSVSIRSVATTPHQLPLANPASSKKFRILSIDGGGVRGVIPARILQAIEEKTGKPISELFDLVIGNSTGGLIALALVTPDQNGKPKYKAADLVEFYKQKTPIIFKASLNQKLRSGWGLWGPRYDRKKLDNILKDLFGGAKLSQTLKPAVVISFSLNYGAPQMWSTHHARAGVKRNYYLRDIAGATSAAPTYFAPKIITNELGHRLHEIDGGIWANNPEFTAIRALSFMPEPPQEKDIILVSIGTGAPIPDTTILLEEANKLKNAGIYGWMIKARPNLVEMMMAADSDWSEALVASLYPNSHRIQVSIPHELCAMDDTRNVEKLRLLAEEYVKQDSFNQLCINLLLFHAANN